MVFFTATGLISIPFSYFFSWVDRPKPMAEGEFKKEKDRLAKIVDIVLKDGRKLYKKKLDLDAENSVAKYFELKNFSLWKEGR